MLPKCKKVYFQRTQLYFQSAKVYSRVTKVYFRGTKVYFRSTHLHFQLQKYTFQVQKYTFEVQKYTFEVQKPTWSTKKYIVLTVWGLCWYNFFIVGKHALVFKKKSFFGLWANCVSVNQTIPHRQIQEIPAEAAKGKEIAKSSPSCSLCVCASEQSACP